MQLGLIVLPTNAAEMDKVLAALSKLGVAYTSAAAVTEDAPAPAAAKKEAPAKAAPKKEALKVPTGAELQAIMTRVRDEHDGDTVAEILTAYGATKLKELDKSDWPAVYAAAETVLNGVGGDDDLGEDDDDLLGDDDDLGGEDDDLDGEELDPEEVKTACQAHATKNGKAKTQAILEKNGLNTVRGLKSADQKTLAAIMKAVG